MPASAWRRLKISTDVVLVTDGHPAYPAFARKAGISQRAVKLSAGAVT